MAKLIERIGLARAHSGSAPGAPAFGRLCAHERHCRTLGNIGRRKPAASRRSEPSRPPAGVLSGCTRLATRGALGPVALWLLAAAPATAAEPLRLAPENPHYFLFRGKPTLVISSGEHYGAVLNLDFDYKRYLEALGRDGLNGTRTWVGAYCESYGAFGIMRNTLAPGPNRFICPWARGRQPGYQNGGNRFDLTRWDEAYFKRLRDFVSQAGKRAIIVEVNLFCPFYEESMWQFSPMNARNNVNGLGAIERTNVYTLDKSGNLLPVQEALTRKVVGELSRFDNLYYEVCNEPYFGGVTLAWQRHIEDVIVETEQRLGRRHLISRNIANEQAKVEDPEPALSILNFHYASPPDAVGLNYELNRVIGDNETGFRGTADAPYRMEAWDFIVAGGGLFNNLDYSFTAGAEGGAFVLPASQPGGGGPALRRQLRFLGEFMRHFDLVHLQPLAGLVVGGVPAGMSARALGRPGQDYIIYLRLAPQAGRKEDQPPARAFAEGQVVLEAALPAGEFNAQWFNPKEGSLLRPEHVIADGGPAKLPAPAFEDDIVLAVRRGGALLAAKASAPARPAAAPPAQATPAPAPQPTPPEAAKAPVPEQPVEPEVQAPPVVEQAAARPPESVPLPSQVLSDADYRVRAWETILTTAPGSRKVSYATVPEGSSQALRQQIRFLNDFFRRHEPGKMEPAEDLISNSLPAGIAARAVKRPGKDYIIYLHRTARGAGEAETSSRSSPVERLTLELALPPGEFSVRWFDTKEGLTVFSERFTKGEGTRECVVPAFRDDIVVAIHATAVVRAKAESKAAGSSRPAGSEPKLPKPMETTTPPGEPSAPAPAVAAQAPTPAATAETNQVQVAKPNWLRRLFGAGTPGRAAQAKPAPAHTEAAAPEPVTPPPARMEAARTKPVQPPPARTDGARTKPVQPPVRTEAARSAVPQVWIDPAYRPPTIAPAPAQAEISRAKTATPLRPPPETAKAKTVAPPPARTEAAKSAVARVWVDPAYRPPGVAAAPAPTRVSRPGTGTPPRAPTQAATSKSAPVPRVWVDPAYQQTRQSP